MSKFEQTFCSQCGGSFGAGDSGYSHCYDHQSPGVRKAMTRFWAGLTERRVAEFGLPWHVEPWGDGSKPPYVNILSESHAVVIAADLERDVANWIVSMANAAISPIEAEEPKAEGEMREALEEIAKARPDMPPILRAQLRRERALVALAALSPKEGG